MSAATTGSGFWRRPGKLVLGVVLVTATLSLLLLGSHLVISGLALAGVAVAAYEVSRLLGRNLVQHLVLAAAVVLACLACWWLLSGSRTAVNEYMFLAMLAWLLVAPLNMMRPLHPSRKLRAALWGFFLVSAWLAVAVLAEYDRWMLVIGLSAVWLSDSCAWFCGSRFGTKPLAPALSPNKSWEGVYGSLVGLSVLAFILWWAYLDGIYAHWLVLLVATAITGLTVLGDLVESAFKREARVKDSGNFLGSHGGLLDRIDSWLPTLPFLALLSTLSP